MSGYVQSTLVKEWLRLSREIEAAEAEVVAAQRSVVIARDSLAGMIASVVEVESALNSMDLDWQRDPDLVAVMALRSEKKT